MPVAKPKIVRIDESRCNNDVLQKCFRCGNSEKEALLFPCRKNGDSAWVCIKCFPPLIHG